MPNPESTLPPPGHTRHGSLDLPLTVWHVPSSRDLIYGLVTELTPTGHTLTIGIDGWEALPQMFDRSVTVITNQPTTTGNTHRQLPLHHRQRVDIRPVGAEGLTEELRHFPTGVGLVVASAEILRVYGAIEAAIGTLHPGGFLALTAEDDVSARDVALWSPVAVKGDGLALAFVGFLVATTKQTLDRAKASPQINCLPPGTGERRQRSHAGVSIWTTPIPQPTLQESA